MRRKMYLVHGYEASKDSHWFNWLKAQLTPLQVDLEIMDMPNSKDPQLDQWLNYLNENIRDIDNDTIIIGHSLGSITVLKFLEQLDMSICLKHVFLVAGFYEHIAALPILDRFTKDCIDFSQLKTKVQDYTVIASKDDYIVPFALTKNLAYQLDAQFYELDGYGHFMAVDGCLTFELLLSLIKEKYLQDLK